MKIKNLFKSKKPPTPDKKWGAPVKLKGEDESTNKKKYIIVVQLTETDKPNIYGIADSVEAAKKILSESEFMLIHRAESKRIKNFLKKYTYPKIEILGLDVELCWSNIKK